MKIYNTIALDYNELLEWKLFKKDSAIEVNFGMKNLELILYWPVTNDSKFYMCTFIGDKI